MSITQEPTLEPMTTLLTYIGTDPSLVACAMHLIRDEVADVVGAVGRGVGYEQHSRMLLRKRPTGADEVVNLGRLGSDLSTRAFIGYVLPGGDGIVPPPDDRQPFRWRGWLFASTGQLPDLDVVRPGFLRELPDFLVRNIRGASDEELLFHRLLYHLRAIRPVIDGTGVPPANVMAAVSATLLELEELGDGATLALTLTDGETLYAATLGVPLTYLLVDGVRNCRRCVGQPLFAGHKPKRIDHDHLKAAILMPTPFGKEAEPAHEGWSRLAARSVACIRPDVGVECDELPPKE